MFSVGGSRFKIQKHRTSNTELRISNFERTNSHPPEADATRRISLEIFSPADKVAFVPKTLLMEIQENKRTSWAWIPSLYFAEGIPYVVVMALSVIMYKRLGISNTDIALYTSWLYLPWVIKPLWSPIVDILKTKRAWIVAMQLIIGAALGAVALTIPAPNFFKASLAVFWLLAFSSATHDIAADGFYMLGLSKHDQAWFVGIRSTFYRLAMITGQGLLIMLAGAIESKTGLPPVAVQVKADPTISAAANDFSFDPGSIQTPPTEGELHLVAQPEVLKLAPHPRGKAEVDALMAKAKNWNKEHGFYAGEKSAATKAQTESLWKKTLSAPLGDWLEKTFPKETIQKSAVAGNAEIVFFTLSKEPPADKNIVVNFGFEKGDKSIALREGERFTFNSKNWNTPFAAVLQLDPKLETATSATFKARSGNIPFAWSTTLLVLAALFLVFCIYHKFVLPRPASDVPTAKSGNLFAEFFKTLGSYFQKPGILTALAFILLYRFAEAQSIKLLSPFLLDAREVGGLGLTTGQVGFVYGTVGIICLTLGGLFGGFLAAKYGLKKMLPIMICAIHLPNAAFVYLSFVQPDNFFVINLCIAVEQFGYGFGFAAYMLYLLYFSDGEHKTAHYAICTGFMALGMMLPGMAAGAIQDHLGYVNFFIWVLIATIPSFGAAALIKIDPAFGKRAE